MTQSGRSIIRWAGSKKKLLPQIETYWAKSGARRYVEPFAGSAAFLFHASPEEALINDSNAELIHALSALKSEPELIHHKVMAIQRASDEYYRQRALDPRSLSSHDRAVRFFYLNRFCFNGIYRVNNAGRFNVPYANSKTGAVPPLDEWMRASRVLQSTGLFCEDFEAFCLREVKANDFVYLDPPYAVSNRRVFSQYGTNSFGLDDMGRLSLVLEELNNRGAKFLVSYARSPESTVLSGSWSVRRTRAQRNVAGFRKHRRLAVEMLISNIDM